MSSEKGIYNLIAKDMMFFNRMSGIYALWYKDEIIYIGQSRNIGSRLFTHSKSGEAFSDTLKLIFQEDGTHNRCKALAMYHFISMHHEDIKFSVLELTEDLNNREEFFISKYLPRYNYIGVDVPYRC